MPKQQKQKKKKRPDNRPARARYWGLHTLMEKKVRNIIRNRSLNGEDPKVVATIRQEWKKARGKRRMK